MSSRRTLGLATLASFALPALLSLALLAPGAALAKRRAKPKILATVDLSFKKPDFAKANRMRAVDRGVRLYLGKGIGTKHHVLHLLRVADGKRETVSAPLPAYIAQRPELARLRVSRLIGYDSQDGVAALLVHERYSRTVRTRRLFVALWNLKTRSIAGLVQLGHYTRGQRGPRLRLREVGYDPQTKRALVLRSTPQQGAWRTELVAISAAGKKHVLTRFDGLRSPSRAYVDFKARRLLCTEYAEATTRGPPPKGTLIDLDAKAGAAPALRFQIPLTTYGAVIDAQRLYLYSAQRGQLWTVDGQTGKKLATLRVGRLGHALGRLDAKTMLLIRAGGVRKLRIKGKRKLVRKGRLISMKRIVSGPILNVSGSKVLGGRALILRSRKLLVVDPG
jgi:hypothetical protein